MAGPPVSCRTWSFFDLSMEWGRPSFMASFPPSGEGVLMWRVTGWEIPGVGAGQCGLLQWGWTLRGALLLLP